MCDGKATGKNKNWYNLEFVQPELKIGEKGSVYLSRVDHLEIKTDSNVTNEQDESVMILEGVSFDDAKCENPGKRIRYTLKNQIWDTRVYLQDGYVR